MAGSSQKDDDELITAINVTPLVDVVLVLLIVLMVTANFLATRGINMDLPSAASAENAPRQLTISVDQNRNMFLDGEAIGRDALRTRIREHAARGGAQAAVTIAAHPSLPHGFFTGVVDMVRKPCAVTERCPGVTRIVIQTGYAEEATTPTDE